MKNNQPKERRVQSKPVVQTPPQQADADPDSTRPAEIGGPWGPEPTRYGDWEQAGRCTDF